MKKINSRQKGKRGERYFVNFMKKIWPIARRNAGVQSQSGGVDIENTGCFNFEVKCGKENTLKKVRSWITQIKEEGQKANYGCVLVKPEREEPYVVLPFDDFFAILQTMKAEGIL